MILMNVNVLFIIYVFIFLIVFLANRPFFNETQFMELYALAVHKTCILFISIVLILHCLTGAARSRYIVLLTLYCLLNTSLVQQWCELDERCHRLQLNDLLISPMQHCTKVPLLLNNIRRYTEDPQEQQLLTVSLQKLETSLRKYWLHSIHVQLQQ